AMAGNIIPAIATTNAIVAGMMATQAILVLTQRLPECHTAYVVYGSKRARTIVREPLAAPNPRCPVCRRRYLTLRVANCARTTLGDVLDHVRGLTGSGSDLGLGDDIAVVEGSRILYDPDFDDNLAKSLEGLGLVPGKMVTLTSEDDDSGAVVPVILSIATQRAPGDSAQAPLLIEGFQDLPEFPPLPESARIDGDSPAADAGSAADGAAGPPADGDDGAIILDDDGAIALDDDDDGSGAIALDDDNGAIALDNGVGSGEGVLPAHIPSMEHISDELRKRKLDEANVAGEDNLKRRAVSDAEHTNDVIALE
ncbi:E1 ubiquitin-activating protein uba2, partial [Coemansia biformis]